MHRVRFVGIAMAAVVVAWGPFARGQVGEQVSKIVSLVVDSGVHDNPSPNTELVFEKIIDLGDAAWFRLIFDDARLHGGSFVRITSLLDGVAQELDAVTVEQWKKTTAYFNGGAGRLALYAGPKTSGVAFRTSAAVIGAPPGPLPETLCDGNDDRVPDDRDGIARMVTLNLSGPCSATIVSDAGCFFSAGHCFGILGIAQFNVPPSTPNGTMQHPGVEDQYIVDPSSIVFVNGGQGNDYAYFTCFPNTQTGLTPLEGEGGVFYPLAKALPPVGTILRVTGFGLDDGAANNTQQTDTGEFLGVSGNILRHRVDTTGGNSGSSIVIEATNEVVGIHTHGGCDLGPETFNSGTAITHPALQPGLICCEPPVIETQPADVTACAGNVVTLSVTLGGGDVTDIQWQRDGQDIPGATATTLVIDPLTESDAGEYQCVVTGCATVLSDPATVAVIPPINITLQPIGETHSVGDNVFLSVAATGGTITFQWRKDGIDIPGANSFFLVLTDVQCADAGVYDVTMVNDCDDSAVSDPATLTIVPCPGAINGDGDGDGDIDLVDFGTFLACVQGPAVPITPPCDVFDFDADGDVDRIDFGAFQLAFTGP